MTGTLGPGVRQEYILLPQPVSVKYRPGRLCLRRGILAPSQTCLVPDLRRELGQARKVIKHSGSEPTPTLSFSLCASHKSHDSGRAFIGDESYSLTVRSDGVDISARDLAGQRMGLRTLAQMIDQSPDGTLPCVEIRDAPALTFRGVHLDMKNVRYKIAYLEQIFDRLAALKVNVVVLEYEDKFPFSRELGVKGNDAYSTGEVKEIVGMLNARGICTVPLQQTFGHLNYVLKHAKYAGLRENLTLEEVLCPLVRKSGDLIRRIIDEVAELHPQSPWFHMGGDEVRMGMCPRCEEKAARIGLSGIYMDFIGPIVEHVRSKGYEPMLWADMFLRYYEKNGALAGKVVLVDWNYGATQDAKAAEFWRLHRALTPDEFHNHYPDESHPEHRRAFKRYFPRPGEKIDALYTTRYLRDRGYKVIGAPSVSTGVAGWFPDPQTSIRNIVCHSRSALEKKAMGTLVTRWAECLPHWETAWPGMAAGAAYGWNPETNPDDFEDSFCRVFFGAVGKDVFKALKLVTAEHPVFSSLRWSKTTYDGALGARDVDAEIKAVLSRTTCRELERIAALACNNAKKAVSILAGFCRKATRNKFTIQYMDLGARLLALRAEEAQVFFGRGTVRGNPVKRLVRLEKQASRMRTTTEERLNYCMDSKSVKKFLEICFDGESRLPGLAADLNGRRLL